MNHLNVINRTKNLFEKDLKEYDSTICEIVGNSRFLVIGGGGSIGQAVTKELFKRQAKALHVVDLNENYLVELVRDIRSGLGYITKDFDSFALDCGSDDFKEFMKLGKYDFVLNLSALKHVRSENSSFSMLRMIRTNITNTLKTYNWATEFGAKKYFCVSTDKAANPANFMGATKRAMELCLMRNDFSLPTSGARFANVAFSHGSLLEGFKYRIEKQQPLSLPVDVSRFFITPEEAGIICLFSSVLGEKNDIFFPASEDEIKLTSFTDIAENYLASIGKTAVKCSNENEARKLVEKLDLNKYWPINVFNTDTSGEKPYEEFYTNKEIISHEKFYDLATVKFTSSKTRANVQDFIKAYEAVDLSQPSARTEFINILNSFVPTFNHIETNKFLNQRM